MAVLSPETSHDVEPQTARLYISKWVNDLDSALRYHHETHGLGGWRIHEAGPPLLRNLTFLGEPTEMTFREAMLDLGPLTLVLTQPLAGPDSLWEWLAAKGERFWHIILFVPTREEAESASARLGEHGLLPLLTSDLGESVRNIVLDSEELLNVTLEICGGDASAVFPIAGDVEPLATYPPTR